MLLSIFLSLSTLSANAASTDIKCTSTLKPLDKIWELEHELPATPPTTNKLSLRFNPCAKLGKNSNLKEQCIPDTRACVSILNYDSSKNERIIAVVPAGQDDPTEKLEDGDDFTWTFGSSEYVNKSTSTLVRFSCGSEAFFVKWEGNHLELNWKGKEVCKSSGDKKDPEKKEPETKEPTKGDPVTSGGGWSVMFWIFILFLVYMIGHTIYRFSVLREGFPQCIPHLSLWQYLFSGAVDLVFWVYEKFRGASNQYVRI